MLARNKLGIYVDESGNFGDTKDPARYCMVALVLHDEDCDIMPLVSEYHAGIYNAGADPDSMSFHTAPLIRREDQFTAMSRNMRGKIFYQMLSLVRKCDLRYKSFWIDTNYVASEDQIVESLKRQVRDFMGLHHDKFAALNSVCLYYDAGQKGVTRILKALWDECACPVEIAQGVRQDDFILLQVADFICTVKLIERRIEEGTPFNLSEKKFFGSPRDFKRNVLRKIKPKELL